MDDDLLIALRGAMNIPPKPDDYMDQLLGDAIHEIERLRSALHGILGCYAPPAPLRTCATRPRRLWPIVTLPKERDPMTQSQDDIADAVYRRWGMSARPTLDREQIAQALAISVGLGALFDENEAAERQWMKTPRKELRGTPYNAALQGRLAEVLALVERERFPTQT